MARQTSPIDQPAHLVFPEGSFVKVTNTGSQIVWVADREANLFQKDPASNTPFSGKPMAPGEAADWYGESGLWILSALPGGEIEYSFSDVNPANMHGAIAQPVPGYKPSRTPLVEWTAATFFTPLRRLTGR